MKEDTRVAGISKEVEEEEDDGKFGSEAEEAVEGTQCDEVRL